MIIKAPRGNKKTCNTWSAEGAMRMLMNNLDPEVAERPENLVVYGGTGKAARNWECYHAIVKSLKALKIDETLLVQSGKPVGIVRTHPDAPRVLIANSHLVPAWANWDYFREMEARGLIMYGQMTAGSWIYIGTQGILQGTYETFGAVAAKHFGGSLAGKLVVTAGLGGMGGAQPLAVTMNSGVVLAVEVDASRIERRVKTGYCDVMVDNLDEALRLADTAKKAKTAKSIGLLGNAAVLFPELVKRQIPIDVLTDQTSAHDPLNGYVPAGLSLEEAADLRHRDPKTYLTRSMGSIAVHVKAMLTLQQQGAVTFDYGNNIRKQAELAGVTHAFDFPGFVPAYIRPLFCEGKGPFRWVALSGDPKDIAVTDEVVLKEFGKNASLKRWIQLAKEKIQFQGLPARICWLGQGERARMGMLMNRLVAKGKISAPIVIGRDHLDCGSVASPYRETESMKDGSDAIADWPILNALVNTASGASWVSLHHGGGVGIGYSIHAGQVTVAEGSKACEKRLERVLTNDPLMGVIRHVDAGYPEAATVAKRHRITIPLPPHPQSS